MILENVLCYIWIYTDTVIVDANKETVLYLIPWYCDNVELTTDKLDITIL